MSTTNFTALSEAENMLCKDQLGMLGSFYKTLFQAIRLADNENRDRLYLAFPDLVNVIYRYKNESGYFQMVCEQWNKENPNHKIIA